MVCNKGNLAKFFLGETLSKAKWLKGIIADVHSTVRIGKNSFVWSFAVICRGVVIGDNCVIGSGVYIGKGCRIGNNVRIQDKAHITDRMTIEDSVFIGPCAVTMNDKYPKVNNPKYEVSPPYFETGCSIGANSMILPGVRVGSYAIVGAGSVVTKNVTPGTLVYGIPSRESKKKLP